jgi:hypothetical protein
MMLVYGPEANPNQDIYILVGDGFPKIGDAFRSCGYVRENPTKESVKKIKTEYSHYRQACKRLHLSAAYGSGPGKWKAILLEEGMPTTLDEAKRLYAAYWSLFEGVKSWERFLVAQWEQNGGWFLNPLGHPTCVDVMFKKDICNRAIQRGGHSILVLMLQFLTEKLTEKGVRFNPWMADQHDEYFFEVHEADGPAALAAAKEAEDILNAFLQASVRIKFGPQLIPTWKEAKD